MTILTPLRDNKPFFGAQSMDRSVEHKKVLALSGMRFYGFLVILCGLAFTTAYFSKNQIWGAEQLLVVFALIAIGILLTGISLHATALASVAMLPNLTKFIPIGNVGIALTEIFMLLFIAIFFFRKKGKITKNKLPILLGGLFLASLASLIGSPLGLLSIGMLLRFGLLLIFCAILVSLPPDKSPLKPIVYGLLLIPLIALASYSGEDALFGMFHANVILLSRAIYSHNYPIWFSLLLPFLVFIRAPRLIVFAGSLFIMFIIVMSFSRSVIIGTAAAVILFLFCYKNNKPVARIISKTILLILCGIAIILVTITLEYFEFTSVDRGESNEWRYFKMRNAIQLVKDHPLLGAGFGASTDEVFSKDSSSLIFGEIISAEFGPLTALTEIGLIGALFVLSIMFISFKHSVKCLRDRKMPMYYKLIVLITFGGFVSAFISSNSVSSIIVYVFLAVPIIVFKYSRSSSRLSEHKNLVAAT